MSSGNSVVAMAQRFALGRTARNPNTGPVKVIDPDHDLEVLDEMVHQKHRARIIAEAGLSRIEEQARTDIEEARAAAVVAAEEHVAAVDEFEAEISRRGTLCRK